MAQTAVCIDYLLNKNALIKFNIELIQIFLAVPAIVPVSSPMPTIPNLPTRAQLIIDSNYKILIN